MALLLFSVVVPIAIRHGLPNERLLRSSSFINSVFACVIVALTGFLVRRRVSAFPGTASYALVVPSFAMTFAAVTAALLALRLDYSASLLFMNVVTAVLVAFVFVHLARDSTARPFYIVPNGNIDILNETPWVNWSILAKPELPVASHAVIVADLRADHGFEWEQMLTLAALANIPVYHVKQVRESLTGRVMIEHLSENSLGTLSPDVTYSALKRLIDVVACVVLLPLLTPFIMAIAALIILDSPGPVLFLQRRIGYGGHPFKVVKFRTMRNRPTAENEDQQQRDALTLVDDDRVTRIGRWLRRSRFDEVPQLLNVLVGQMSLIGPRPEAEALSRWYSKELPFYLYRHVIRPGITGWAQVNQGHVAELADVNTKLHYDFFYIKNLSLWLDILIVLRTVQTILTGFGAR